MPVLNTDHLFEQADRLAAVPVAGAPRQVDLRRAISATYYGLFHFVTTCVADQFVGKTQRSTIRYALVYRSVDHRSLRDFCDEARKATPGKKFVPHFPPRGFADGIQVFATAILDMQEKRHRADYDPTPRFKTSDVQLSIDTARSAVRRFQRVKSEQRKLFLTLLMFPPR